MTKFTLLSITIAVLTVLSVSSACGSSASDDDDDASSVENTDDDDATSSNDLGNTEDSAVWSDAGTGLIWQNDNVKVADWFEAVEFCENLNLAGSTSWRLPTISELRTLIVDCSETITAGACEASDDCLDRECLSDQCRGCEWGGGPGTEGRYWPNALDGEEDASWSSSKLDEGETDQAWLIRFGYAYVVFDHTNRAYPGARCVRP